MFDEDNLSENDMWQLQSYVDGELSPVERLEFEQSLANSPVLTAELQRWLALYDDLSPGFLTEIEPQIDFSAAVVAKLQAELAPLPKRIWPIMTAQAALAVVLLGWQWSSLITFQSSSQTLFSWLQAEFWLWLDQFGRWIFAQQVTFGQLSGLVDWQSTLRFSPDMFLYIVTTSIIGGFAWLFSVGYILRSRDWRPVNN